MRGTVLQSELKKNIRDLWVVPVLALACALTVIAALALFKTPEYSSEIQVLVVQKYTLTDSYTASKSAEKISSNLAEVIGTSTFFDAVVSDTDVDLDRLLSLSESEKRKAWKRMVTTDVIPQTSILKISAYDPDPAAAEELANAVANILIENGGEYHGAADTVTLKIVDSALTSDRPTRPNLLLNGLAAAVFGGALGLIIVLLKPSGKGGRMRPRHASVADNSGGAEVIDMNVDADHAGVEQLPSYSVLDVTNYHEELNGGKKDRKV